MKFSSPQAYFIVAIITMEFSGVTTSVFQLEHEGVTITALMCTQDNKQKMYICRLCPLCNSCWTISEDPDCTVLYLKCFFSQHFIAKLVKLKTRKKNLALYGIYFNIDKITLQHFIHFLNQACWTNHVQAQSISDISVSCTTWKFNPSSNWEFWLSDHRIVFPS